MNAPSPWPRILIAFAIVLGVADGALLLAWSLREPAAVAMAAAPREQTDRGPVAPAAGNANDAAAVPAAAAPVDTTPAPAAAPSAVLCGTIARPDGKPVARGFLWLTRDGEQVGSSSVDGGTYAFAGLRPGQHRITSRIDDALPLALDLSVEAPLTRRDLVLDACWVLKVHAVTPDGTALAEELQKLDPRLGRIRSFVAAAFAAPLPGDLPLSDLAEVEVGIGTFRADQPFRGGAAMEKKTVGMLTLPPRQPVHVALLLRSAVVAQQPVAADQEEVTFTIDPARLIARTASVKLRVVDAQGAPVSKCQVSLNDRQTGGGGKATGDDGRVALERLLPGRLRLGLMHEKMCGPPLSIDVPPGADLDLGDVTVLPWVEIAFAGDAFGGKGSVRLTWLDAPTQPGMSVSELYLSAENGPTLRSMLYPGRYALCASTKGKAALGQIDTKALPPLPIHLDLQPAAALRVRGGTAGRSVVTELRAPNGALFLRRALRGPMDFTLSLPPGPYAVTFVDEAGVRTQRTVVLSRDGAVLDVP